MASQVTSSFIASPKKRGGKKSKRRSSNDDDSTRSNKAQRVKGDHTMESAVEYCHDSGLAITTQEPRRSSRSGAGLGGRTQQLAKLGALFEDRPTKVSKSTDLPDDTSVNPLAPPMKWVQPGRRGARKKGGLDGPPPPYAPASQNEVQVSTAAPAPVFHQRSSESDRFGFIVPPGTEPNLQALNNPYVAAREQQAKLCSLRSSEPARQPSSALERPPIDHPLGSSLPSRKDLVDQPRLRVPSSRAFESPPIDPALSSLPPFRSVSMSSRALGTSASLETSETQSIDPALLTHSLHSRQSPESSLDHHRAPSANQHADPYKGSDYSSSSSDDTSSESGRTEATEVEAEDGWGATNSRQVAHPGFSQESQPPNNPVRHASLPADHEFTFSRDEDDESARHNLGHAEPQVTTHGDDLAHHHHSNDTRLVQHGDVLNRHHRVNGRPSAPDPQALVAARPAESQESVRTRAPRNSKKAKDAGPSPQNLGFYPPVWQDCLEDAKRECRVSHLLTSNPFPSKSHDLKSSITESLTTTVAEWNDAGTVFEPDCWPKHKVDMACVLLGDMSTWRSELKTTAFAVAPVAYNLIPPQDIITPREKAQWAQSSATQLLADSLFLRNGVDELGKTNNFAHPALKEVVIRFFYAGSYRIADKRSNVFRKSVPLPCVALAGAALNCVLDGFVKNGGATLKTVPQFSGKGYRSTFLTMVKMLNEILRHPYHGQKLSNQLENWANEGWAALHHVDMDVERDNHLQLLLD